VAEGDVLSNEASVLSEEYRGTRAAGSKFLVFSIASVEGKRYPYPSVFLTKSVEIFEKKEVMFLMSAKKCKNAQKSA